MSSQRMIRRENKRIRLHMQKSEQRKELRKQLNDPNLDIDTKFKIIAKFEKLPRDSSGVRLSRRCSVTGRKRGVLRKFSLCRNELRRRAMSGEVPGLVKSSW